MALLEWHYVLTLFILFFVWLFSTVKKIHRQINRRNSRIPDVKILHKIIPPSCNNGWRVTSVCNALPVWRYNTTFTFAPNHLIATRTVLQAKSTRILDELQNIKVFSMIFPEFPPFRQKKGRSVDGDVLYLSNMFSSLSLHNMLLTGQQTELMFERYWSSEPNFSWLCVSPTVQLLSSKYGHWICFLITEMADNCSLLHILASFPETVSPSFANQIITSCQVLIKHHFDSVCQDECIQISEPPVDDSFKVKRSAPCAEDPLKTASSSMKEDYGHVEEPAVIKHVSTPGSSNLSHTSNKFISTSKTVEKVESSPKVTSAKEIASPLSDASDESNKRIECIQDKVLVTKQMNLINKKLEPYLNIIKEGYKLMMSIYEADEKTEGWELLNHKNDVIVHKKVGTEQFPNDIYKGRTTINVPVYFLMNYLLNMDNKTEYDDVFESGSTVEDLGDDISKVIHLVYKNLWPVTGRDFCSISAPRHVKDNLYGILVKGVTHPDCPETKNKVRGECVIGGYIVEDLSDKASNITFIVCANFNGYIPSKIVNKVSADQPLSVGVIRKKVEQKYLVKGADKEGKEWMNKFHGIPSVYPKAETPLQIVAENTEGNIQNCNNDITAMSNTIVSEPVITPKETSYLQASKVDVVAGDLCPPVEKKNILPPKEFQDEMESVTANNETKLSDSFDLKEDHYTSVAPSKETDDISDDDSASLDDMSQCADDGMYQSSLSINEPVEYPRDSFGEIDFVSLGNQCATALEEEFILIKKVDTSVRHDPAKQEKDQWKYQGTSKDITIMRKVSSRQKIHSFLGRGVINVLPVTIWEMIRTPTTRFVYDSMLKKITTIKEINDHMKIVHMKHETHACFVKQARDFCFMTVERVKEEKYLLCGTSVDIPECPVSSDCVRGTVFSSGWIIEPIVQNGRSCSLVTYISQVDFGGRLPSRLVNFIAKRQPLAVAYLRNYLEAAEQ